MNCCLGANGDKHSSGTGDMLENVDLRPAAFELAPAQQVAADNKNRNQVSWKNNIVIITLFAGQAICERKH